MTFGDATAEAAAATAGEDESLSADDVEGAANEDAVAGMEEMFPDEAFEEEDALFCFVDVEDDVDGCESLSISLGGSNGVTLKGGWG